MIDKEFTLSSYSPLFNNLFRAYLKSPDHPSKQRLISLLKNITGNKRIVSQTKSGFSMSLDLRDLVQREIFYSGYWEYNLSKFFTDQLKSDDTFFDIGGNVGYFSLLASQLKIKEVCTFEPDKHNVQIIGKNVDLNTFENIKIYEMGIGKANEKLSFYRANVANNGYSGFLDRNSCESFTVNVKKLDSLVYEEKLVPKPTVLKVDTEGWEEQVFDGASHLLEKDPPRLIVFESEDLADESINNFKVIKEKLEKHGYLVVDTITDIHGVNHIAKYVNA